MKENLTVRRRIIISRSEIGFRKWTGMKLLNIVLEKLAQIRGKNVD